MGISEQQAKEQALMFLNKDVEPDEEVEITNSITEQFGWIFFYQSRLFLETDDFKKRLFGSHPVVVEKTTGEVHYMELPWGTDLNKYKEAIDAYRYQRNQLGRSHDEVDFSTT